MASPNGRALVVDAGGVGGPVEMKLGVRGVVVDEEGVVVVDEEVVVVDEEEGVVVVDEEEGVVVVDEEEGVVVVVDEEVVGVDEVRQTGFVIVLDSSVTAPFRANRRPLIVAPVFAVMEVSANTVP